MRRETYLLELSLFFFSGNILSHFLIGISDKNGLSAAAVISLISSLILLNLYPKGCGKNFTRFLIFFFAGSLGYSNFAFSKSFRKENKLKDNAIFEIRGVAEMTGRSKSNRKFVELRLMNENTIIYNIPEEIKILPGDIVSAEIRAKKIENFISDFDYKKMMNEKGIFCTAFLTRKGKIKVSENSHLKIRHRTGRLRDKYIDYISNYSREKFSRESIALSIALTCGDKTLIQPEIYENFRKSGSIHLLTLSGLHLGIIYAILSALLSVFGNYLTIKRIRSALIIIVLWSYTIFTGLGISTLRAVIMISLYEISVILGKERNGINALAMSIITIGTFLPSSPSSISFQLSCGAMAGIFLIYPSIKKSFHSENFFLKKIFDMTAVSVSCQIVTAPLILSRFGTYSAFSLIANILCSPIVTLIIIFIPITILLTAVIPCASGFSATLLNFLTKALIKINEIIANFNPL